MPRDLGGGGGVTNGEIAPPKALAGMKLSGRVSSINVFIKIYYIRVVYNLRLTTSLYIVIKFIILGIIIMIYHTYVK